MANRAQRRREEKEAEKKPASVWGKHISPNIYSTEVFIVTTIGGNALNNISSIWAFIVFIAGVCYLFSSILPKYIWSGINKLSLKYTVVKDFKFKENAVKKISVFTLIVIILSTSQFYVDLFIKNQGTMKLPTSYSYNDVITVHFGKSVLVNHRTIGQLSQKPSSPLQVYGYDFFTIHIENEQIYVDTALYAGDNKTPVLVKNNKLIGNPNTWDINPTNTTIEVLNENKVPVLLVEYTSAFELTIWGLFDTPYGICRVDNHSFIPTMPTLHELGEYKVKKLHIRNIIDLIWRERTYHF